MTFQVSLENLQEFASNFWYSFKSDKIFAIYGPMGVGKTTLIAALCRYKGVSETVTSPTFPIINEYSFIQNNKKLRIYHIDLYRLNTKEEIIQSGVEDCILSGSVCFVEWPEKASYLFEPNTIEVIITPINETERTVKINRNL